MLTKEMGQIDFTKPAKEIERLIRGLNPWPSAYTSMNGKTMKLWDADVMECDVKEKPGTVIDVTKDAIVTSTGKDALALKEIQLAGKKRMKVSAFLLGYHVEKGTKLGE